MDVVLQGPAFGGEFLLYATDENTLLHRDNLLENIVTALSNLLPYTFYSHVSNQYIIYGVGLNRPPQR